MDADREHRANDTIGVRAIGLKRPARVHHDVRFHRAQLCFDITVANWFGVTAPAQTPSAVVNRIAAEIAAAVAAPDVLAQLRAIGLDAYPPMSPTDFEKFIGAESTSWGGVIRRANIRLD